MAGANSSSVRVRTGCMATSQRALLLAHQCDPGARGSIRRVMPGVQPAMPVDRPTPGVIPAAPATQIRGQSIGASTPEIGHGMVEAGCPGCDGLLGSNDQWCESVGSDVLDGPGMARDVRFPH